MEKPVILLVAMTVLAHEALPLSSFIRIMLPRSFIDV